MKTGKNKLWCVFLLLLLASCEKLDLDTWNLEKKEYHDFLSYSKTIIDETGYFVCSLIDYSDGYFVLVGKNNGSGSNDYYVYKMNKNGEVQSNVYVGSFEGCFMRHLDSSGSFYILANKFVSLKSQIFLIKIDTNLNLLWNRNYYITGFDFMAYSLTIDNSGSLVIVGETDIMYSQSLDDPLIIKTDQNGESPVYYYANLSTSNNEHADDIVYSSDGYYYLIVSEYVSAVPDNYLIKLDESFSVVWKHSISLGYEIIWLTLSSDNGFIAYGADGYSFGYCKINSDGNELWSRHLNNCADGDGYCSLIETKEGDIAVLSSTLILTLFDKSGNVKMSMDYYGSTAGYNFLLEPEEKGFVFAHVSDETGKVTLSKTLPDGVIKPD